MNHAWGYATDQRLRENNEDSFGVFTFPELTLFIVCDGMGGHSGGETASALAVRTIYEEVSQNLDTSVHQILESAITAANTTICDTAKKNRHLLGMGTTVVAIIVKDGFAYVAHVGDSRVYMVRDGEISQVTRDHSMVNLFVDAELLSPEEAASHPEAHVLSRSLGVEKSVDVDLHDAIDLEPGDAFVMCSDGVHGVVTDWELGQMDWSDPIEGTRKVVWTVREREGDDNATLVAVSIGIPPERGEEPTEVPVVPNLEESPTRAVAPLGVRPSAIPPPLAVPSSSIAQPTEEVPIVPDAPEKGTVSNAPARTERRRRKKRKGSKKTLLIAGGLSLSAVCAILGGLVIIKQRQNVTQSQETVTQLTVNQEAPSVKQADPTPAVVPAEQTVQTDTNAENSDTSEPVPNELNTVIEGELLLPPPPAFLFSPIIPEAPKRQPHRGVRFVSAPPGGAELVMAIKAERDKKCALSLKAVHRAMAKSEDYASLYMGTWNCFNRVHQKPLVESQAESADEFLALTPLFQGELDPKEPVEESTPFWYRHATDGIEYRLEAWHNSNESDKFQAVMFDAKGRERVSDHFSVDLLLIGQAAAGLALYRSTDGAASDAWARRVYVLSRSLHESLGQLIEDYRPEVHAELIALLKTATYGASEDPTRTHFLPKNVAEALAVGSGLKDAPERLEDKPPPPPPKVKPKVKPKATPKSKDDGVSMPTIYQRKK